MSKTLTHVLKEWEKKNGWLGWSKAEDEAYSVFFPESFTLIFGEKSRENVSLDRNYRRMYVGKAFWSAVEPGSTLIIGRLSQDRFEVSITEAPIEISRLSLHERAIRKWAEMEESKFGAWFRPDIRRGSVDINEIIPEVNRLKENTKYVDGLARLEIGGRPIYQSVLEVQHRGVREDLVVRIQIVLPFVTRADIIASEEDIAKIRELLELVVSPNVLRAKTKFYTFKEFLENNKI